MVIEKEGTAELPLPPYYIIESTNHCNFYCPICPNAFYKHEKGHMDKRLLMKILDQISESARVIQLYWLGEPLLDDTIFEKVKLCKTMTTAKVILSTNGSLLTEKYTLRLCESGLDELIVSVDACESQEIYGKIRAGGNLKLLNENLETLLKYCGRMKVVLQFIDMFVNKCEKDAFLNKWKYCHTEISCLYTWANQIPALNLSSDHLSPVREKKRMPCADLWTKMAIHWNGAVSACCFDFADHIHLGNCTEETLFAIWNGEMVKKIRQEHQRGYYSGLCKKCDAWAEIDEYEDMFHLTT